MAQPSHLTDLAELIKIYKSAFDTYLVFRREFLLQLSLQSDEVPQAALFGLWYANDEAKSLLISVTAWLSKTYKILFLTCSKRSGHKWVEKVQIDEGLNNAKEKLKDILKALFKEFSKYDIQTSSPQDDFIVDVLSMDGMVVEDIAGAIATMAAEILKLNDANTYEKWRV
jgi:hypothetical protein